jgi:CheY-like chemotaxis protein/anti-sigma regulatory factor (Ser/Thr protein kinase)
VKLRLAADLPAVEADAAQMQQLVMNLVINGAEAIGSKGGTVRVATALRAGHVALEVTDNGCGMDAQTAARIFDPFFTTKFTGRGLGLAAAQGIVRGHKGTISVQSAPGQGTTFTVLLPPTAARPAEAAAVEWATMPATGVVLVADDEEIVRLTARRALERRGLTVLDATEGTEAVRVLRGASAGVSLIVLDMTMPGWSCEQTLEAIHACAPEVPVILSSGYTETEALRRLAAYRLAGFLQKPYTAEKLAQKVAAAMAKQSAASAG